MSNSTGAMKSRLSSTIYLVWPNKRNEGCAIYVPLGIGYIASYLVEKGLDVRILDYTFGKVGELSKEPAIYGIAMSTSLYNMAKEVISDIKEANRENVIIIGGPHATVLPESLIADDAGDYVIIGEGELTYFNLCTALLNDNPVKDIKGIYYKEGKHIRFTGRADFIEDLDSLPFPRYDMFPITDYLNAKPIRELNISTSRGCPFDCIYCQPGLRETFGKKIRHRSANNIVDELEQIKKAYNPYIIPFSDDMVLPQYVEEMCNEILRRKLRIIWRCQARTSLNRDLLRLMKKAGCVNIAFGVESGSQKVLDALNKKQKVDDIIRQFRDCKDVGIFTHAFLMVGCPKENDEDIEKTIDLVKRINPFSIYLGIMTPYPGTHLFNALKKEGRLPETIDWGSMHHSKDDTFYVNCSDGLTPEEIVQAKHKILQSFKDSNKLSRLGYVFSYLKDLDGIRNVFYFVLNHPSALFDVLKGFILMSRGSVVAATNPESKFFETGSGCSK